MKFVPVVLICFFRFRLTWSTVCFLSCSFSSCVCITAHDSSENNSISMFSVTIVIAAFLSVLILSPLFPLFPRSPVLLLYFWILFFSVIKPEPSDHSIDDKAMVAIQTPKTSLLQAVSFQRLKLWLAQTAPPRCSRCSNMFTSDWLTAVWRSIDWLSGVLFVFPLSSCDIWVLKWFVKLYFFPHKLMN